MNRAKQERQASPVCARVGGCACVCTRACVCMWSMHCMCVHVCTCVHMGACTWHMRVDKGLRVPSAPSKAAG